ncbi:8256_t:CDS:1, partial [Ambispora gerdemannii]
SPDFNLLQIEKFPHFETNSFEDLSLTLDHNLAFQTSEGSVTFWNNADWLNFPNSLNTVNEKAI